MIVLACVLGDPESKHESKRVTLLPQDDDLRGRGRSGDVKHLVDADPRSVVELAQEGQVFIEEWHTEDEALPGELIPFHVEDVWKQWDGRECSRFCYGVKVKSRCEVSHDTLSSTKHILTAHDFRAETQRNCQRMFILIVVVSDSCLSISYKTVMVNRMQWSTGLQV